MKVGSNGNANAIEITEIAAVSIADPSAIQLRLLDGNKQEFVEGGTPRE